MNRYHWMLTIYFIVLIWSGINPYNYPTWAAEVVPGIIALLLFGLTYKKLRFNNPKLVSKFEEMREAARKHELLLKEKKKREQKQKSMSLTKGRGRDDDR